MNSELSENYLLVGKVSKPHGIKGELKIFPLSNLPDNFLNYPEFVLLDAKKQTQPLTITKARVQGKFVVVTSKECGSRNRAEELAGLEVWLNEKYLAPLTNDEFYWHQVVNKPVMDTNGSEIGILHSLLNTNGNPVMVIRQGDDEYLVPGQQEFIVSTSVDGIIVDLPPGLLEINKK